MRHFISSGLSIALVLVCCADGWSRDRISQLQPADPRPGLTMTIVGEGFGASQGHKIVQAYRIVNRKPIFTTLSVAHDMAGKSLWSDQRITVFIPRNLPADDYGLHIVTPGRELLGSNNVRFAIRGEGLQQGQLGGNARYRSDGQYERAAIGQNAPSPAGTKTVGAPPVGPDPAAVAIHFGIVSRSDRWPNTQGIVEIVGVVKNVGQAPYRSNAGQQEALLYELQGAGDRNPKLVARKAFQNLAPGQEVRVGFRRSWNSSSPAEGEFPPLYRLVIGYDPDIRLDGNAANDDVNVHNNVKTREGSDINRMFSR
jgi:hypothetical protein